MAGKYQAYPEYQDTNIFWLGSVPEHWVLSKLKFVKDIIPNAFVDGPFGSNLKSSHIIEGGDVYVIESNFATQGILNEDKLKTITQEHFETICRSEAREGDIIIAKIGAQYGKASILPSICKRAVVSGNSLKLSINEVIFSKQFAHYIFIFLKESGAFEDIVNATAQPALSLGDLNNIPIPFPLLNEQQKIANFLDHETAKIDTLIEKQQQLIALLKEKRQAVISHAVTKGLNPDAPMRDSGIEWLGEVPEHWVPTRLKYMKSTESNAFVDGPFGSNLKSEHFVENGDAYVIESNFATTGLIDINKLKTVTNDHYEIIKRSSTKGGDIIIAKIGARYGSSSILPILDKDAVVSGNSLKLTVNPALLNVEYANELLRVLKENEAMDDGVNVTAQPALSLGGLNNLPFLKAPLEEQNEIVNYINSMKEKFNGLIFNTDSFITLAKERRAALISAAVTGKIDVRNWQAPASPKSSIA